MLVQYTHLSTLTPEELSGLKASIRGLTLEGRGSHWVWNGKTFDMNELISAQRMWENQARGTGQQLNG
jgi:hypothetical protein